MKLNTENLKHYTGTAKVPQYSRKPKPAAIIHMGVGGFHRAHEAVYCHKLLEEGGDPEWTICGVGILAHDKKIYETLKSQDYLYTLIELANDSHHKVGVIAAISDFLFAPEDPQAVINRLVSPTTKIVSLTITEGGYPIGTDGRFQSELADIAFDLSIPEAPRTAFGFIMEALYQRYKKGEDPFTVMSCDNLPHNGQVCKSVLLAFASVRGAEFKNWVHELVACPNSMVDRITPITETSHKDWLAENYQIEDDWPVVCESFLQWVIEDQFPSGRPQWERVGVQFTDNVGPYEQMKLSLLNASHSILGYFGTLMNYSYSYEAVNDSLLQGFIRDFMDQDVTPILDKLPGVDLKQYKETLIYRFKNQYCADRLARLCMDGSNKIPKFLVPTITKLIEEDRPLERPALVLASWVRYLQSLSVDKIEDPRAKQLKAILESSEDLSRDFLGLGEIFNKTIGSSKAFTMAFDKALELFRNQDAATVLRNYFNK